MKLPYETWCKITITMMIHCMGFTNIMLIQVELNSESLKKVSDLSLVDGKNVIERETVLKIVN
jgi:hypothetical protein